MGLLKLAPFSDLKQPEGKACDQEEVWNKNLISLGETCLCFKKFQKRYYLDSSEISEFILRKAVCYFLKQGAPEVPNIGG